MTTTKRPVRRVYVAAPYDAAGRVCEVHERLTQHGLTPVSSWAERAHGPEDLEACSDDFLHAETLQNDRDLASADAVLVLAEPGKGGEMFVEVGIALTQGKRLVWAGSRRILTSYRRGVVRVDDVDDGIVALLEMAGLR